MRKRGFFAALAAVLFAFSAVSCDNELHVDDNPRTSEQETTAAEGEKGTQSAETNTMANDINSYITVKESKPALWKVTDPNNGTELYMFGMVYFMTDNTLPLPDYVMDAYKKSDTIAVEFDLFDGVLLIGNSLLGRTTAVNPHSHQSDGNKSNKFFHNMNVLKLISVANI